MSLSVFSLEKSVSAIFAYNTDWKDGGSQLHGSEVQDRELFSHIFTSTAKRRAAM